MQFCLNVATRQTVKVYAIRLIIYEITDRDSCKLLIAAAWISAYA